MHYNKSVRFFATNQFQTLHRRPNSDLGKPARGYCRPSDFTPSNGHGNGYTDAYDERTYTSTMTIRTGSEVGSKDCLDNNQNQTNKPIITSRMENKSPPLVFDPLIIDGKREKAVVGTYAIPRYPITNQRTKSPAFTSYPAQTNGHRQNGGCKLSQDGGCKLGKDKTDFTKTDIDYNTHLTNHRQKFSQVISAMMNGENIVNGPSNNRTMSKYTNNDTRLKNEINHSFPMNFHTSSSSLATFLLAHRATHPETLPASPTTPPDSSSSSISSSPTPPITTRVRFF